MKKVFIFDIHGPVVSHIGDDSDKKMNALRGLTPSVGEHSFDMNASSCPGLALAYTLELSPMHT